MADPVIIFENISVRYRVPHERVSGIKEYIIRRVQRRIQHDEFWALQGVSFEVPRGEIFGIIGRNGAGKSTSLKLIARVLFPTQGRVYVKGALAPLLEIGAGFNAEMTGRENVFFNGAMLGHTRHEMEALVPSIIDFAEIGDFLDAPLRTYSSGMMARLGFSVATCVRPNILLVDEVLAVGDVRFQEKCVRRMRSYHEQGMTIVIVSHSMDTIHNFCQRALWLEGGKVKAIGDADEVASQYLA